MWSKTPLIVFLHLLGRSASRHFSSASLLLHLVGGSALLICLSSSKPGKQVGRSALLLSCVCQPSSTLGRQVGRSALLFPSHYILLDLVGRSASRHFSFASLLLHSVSKSARQYCSPACLLLHLVGRSSGRRFFSLLYDFCTPGRQVGTFHTPAFFYTW